MFYVISGYIVFLLITLIFYSLSKRKLHAIQKDIYHTYDMYFFSLHQFFLSKIDAFYRKDKGIDVFFTQKKKFFSESTYSLHTFALYEKKIIKDIQFIHTLFPEASHILLPLLPASKHYTSGYTWEYTQKITDILLTILTVGVRKIFSTT